MGRTEFVASLKHMQPVGHKFDIPEPNMTQAFWYHFYCRSTSEASVPTIYPFTHSAETTLVSLLGFNKLKGLVKMPALDMQPRSFP